MSPQKTVVYWTEYVLRYNGTRHLRPVAADMPLYSYLLLDILLFMSICAFVIFFVLYYAIKRIYGLLMSRKNSAKFVKVD